MSGLRSGLESSGSDPSVGLCTLCEKDIEALDALVEARWHLKDVPTGLRERAQRALMVMELAGDCGAHCDPALADVTCAFVARSARQRGDARLSAEDESALEAWIDAGYDAGKVAASLRPRAQQHEMLSRHVAVGPQVGSQSLIERTLARVESAEHQAVSADALSFEAERSRRGMGVRLADLVSVAAVLLIAGSILWPVLSHMRSEAREYRCAANLGLTASAFSSYAGSHDDSLPVVNASLRSGAWWDVDTPDRRSNSANLYELVRTGHAQLEDLACPGNPKAPVIERRASAGDWRSIEEISYSYQNMFGPARPRWETSNHAVVLADRSPIVLRIVRGEREINPLENSPNHSGAGQHVLISDGSARWVTEPKVERESGDPDLLWWPRPIEQLIKAATTGRQPSLKGNEVPAGVDDAFLIP